MPAQTTDDQARGLVFLNCSRCGLSIKVRFAWMQMEHCPRCVARARVLQPLFCSPLPLRMLCASSSGMTSRFAAPVQREGTSIEGVQG